VPRGFNTQEPVFRRGSLGLNLPHKMITEQAVRGKGYDVIERVISIIIMDDVLIPEDVDYYNEYGIMNKKTGTVFSDLF
jgi:hypothetical protein